MPLEVGIIGAGIAGLAAAIGQRRAGANVEIFERSAFKNEIGAAITITPNGKRILDAWGFDEARAGMVQPAEMRMMDAKTLETQVLEDFRTIPQDFGAKMGFYHRQDLHATLREMVEADGTPIHLGNGLADIDCEAGTIVLADGTKVQKDLIVVADGIKSNFISKVTGKEELAVDIGLKAYRALVPMEVVLKDPAVAALFEGKPPGYWVPFDMPKAFFMVMYPCRLGKTLNIALRSKSEPHDEDKEDWNAPADPAEILALLAEYNPTLMEIIKKAENVSVHKLRRREPLEVYSRGRAVLIGDAAHTLPPTHAQGAVLAIEESQALSLLFAGVTDAGQVSPRLELYQKLMKKHLHVVQHLSDSMPGVVDENRKRAEALCGDELYPNASMHYTAPVRKFFYGYDVSKEVSQGMKEAGL